MQTLPGSITLTIVLLTVFLVFISALKYTALTDFMRTRLIMTSFFFFIVATLTISFWHYALATLPYTVPAWFLGALVGYFVGVRTAQEKLSEQGLSYYTRHFAHVHLHEFKSFTWWSIVNFYSVMGALVLINFVGFSTVLFAGTQSLAIATSCVGAFLLGTIAPYLLHLWSIRTIQNPKSTTSEEKKT
jgi:hypothetical protein